MYTLFLGQESHSTSYAKLYSFQVEGVHADGSITSKWKQWHISLVTNKSLTDPMRASLTWMTLQVMRSAEWPPRSEAV